MKTLLLTSSGITENIRDIFISRLSKPVDKTKLSFITTAAYGEEVNPVWLEEAKNQLRSHGLKNIEDLDIRDKNQNELNSILSDKDIIFMNGGNTFYLLYWIRKSGLDKLLPKLLDEGKFYVGVSAGSYVACPTIEAAGWKHVDKNKVGLTDLTALDLVPFLISAHFEESYRQIINDAAKTTKYPIVALYDGQAILVEGNSYKIVGENKKEFFNGFAEK